MNITMKLRSALTLQNVISKQLIKSETVLWLIAVALVIVAVGIIAAVISQKEKEMDPKELLECFEKAAEEVLGEDVQRVSQTELVATLTYSHETDKDNNIYYRVLKTTYFEAGDPSDVTGVNTEALNALFPVDMMDSCEEMMIQDWPGALYKKDDTACLCKVGTFSNLTEIV